MSKRKFGVELETSRCNGYRELYGNTIWGCHTDCSIEGREFISPILYGDEGLIEIENFCGNAHRRRWHVNHYCGYHAHFDMSKETWEAMRSIAYAYRKMYDMWCRLVSESRAHNAYAGPPNYSPEDVRRVNSASDWEYFVGARDRFEFVNWRAYLVHGSFEVRSHDATLDKDMICDWVMLHTRFIDYVSCMSLDEIDDKFSGSVESQFAALSEIVGEELATKYADRSDVYGSSVRPTELAILEPPF
jgi:hypothetical protein